MQFLTSMLVVAGVGACSFAPSGTSDGAPADAPIDAATCDLAACPLGCDGEVCLSARLWLSAADPAGDGGAPTPGPITTWVNKGDRAVGDLVSVAGVVKLEVDDRGVATVGFEGGQLRSTGPLAGASNAHLELYVVARSSDPGAGAWLAVEDGGVNVQLPAPTRPFRADAPRVRFSLPVAGALSLPSTQPARRLTIWHAYHGADGGALAVDGTILATVGPRAAAALASRVTLGRDGSTAAASIDVAEVLVFDRPLSDGQRAYLDRTLAARWSPKATAPAEAHLALWLDAHEPTASGAPANGVFLDGWRSLTADHAIATAAQATWRRDGFGDGLPAVELTGEAGSEISLVHPALGDYTAFLVVAWDDGRDGTTATTVPVLFGGDGDGNAEVSLVSRGGYLGYNSSYALQAELAGRRSDDGARHLVIVRRAGNVVNVWVDREPVVVANVGARGVAASSWHLGARATGDGYLAARYGEVLLYDDDLDNATVNDVEQYLAARWRTPVVGWRDPPPGCVAGSHLECPLTSLAAARKLATGRYWFDVGDGPFRASVDAAEGGGWVLVLQYVRGETMNANALRYIPRGADWPPLSTTPLGGTDPLRSLAWGNVKLAAAASLPDGNELRWYGRTTSHTRVLHFRSSSGAVSWRTAPASNAFTGLATTFAALTGHDANLPATADFSNQRIDENMLVFYPFGRSGVSAWSAYPGYLGLDDLDNTASTIHRVWIRQAP